MQIDNGYFKSKSDFPSRGDIVVEYYIDKPLMKKNTYKLDFFYVSHILNSWRKEQKQFEGICFRITVEINKDNSSEQMDDIDKFEGFLKENIQEYWKEARETTTTEQQKLITIGKFDTIEEIINKKELKETFETLGCTDDAKKIEYLKSIEVKAY